MIERRDKGGKPVPSPKCMMHKINVEIDGTSVLPKNCCVQNLNIVFSTPGPRAPKLCLRQLGPKSDEGNQKTNSSSLGNLGRILILQKPQISRHVLSICNVHNVTVNSEYAIWP